MIFCGIYLIPVACFELSRYTIPDNEFTWIVKNILIKFFTRNVSLNEEKSKEISTINIMCDKSLVGIMDCYLISTKHLPHVMRTYDL